MHPFGAAIAADPVRLAQPRPPPPAREASALAVYLLCVGTLGFYAPVWIYRTGRALAPEPDDRPSHLAWSFAAFIPLLACLVLFELTRLATAQTPPRARFDYVTPASVACLLLAIIAALVMTPLAALWSLKLLLLPIPFALCQATVNQAARARAEVGAGRRVLPTGVRLALAAGCILATGAALWADAGAWQRWLADTHARGAKLSGASGRYAMTIGEGQWKRVPAGTFGDADSDLELDRVDGESWLVAYVHPKSDLDLEGYVAARRSTIEGEVGALAGFTEHRYFVDADRFIVASLARYETGRAMTAQTFWVLTAVDSGTGYEVIANSAQAGHDERAFETLLTSFTLSTERGAP